MCPNYSVLSMEKAFACFHFQVCLIICGFLLVSFIANIFRLREYNTVECKAKGHAPGLTLQLSATACEPAHLWGYSTVFILGLNNIVPIVVLIIATAYIIIKLHWEEDSNYDGLKGTHWKLNQPVF